MGSRGQPTRALCLAFLPVGRVPMKRHSPSELEEIDTPSIYSEFISGRKHRKMAETAETKTSWEKTWQAIDFDDGTHFFPPFYPNIRNDHCSFRTF